jgi:excinuclease ABC subunit C
MARAAKKLPNGGRPTSQEELTALERQVTDGAAARPGVYRMLSEEGGVIYVGKSKRVRERLLGYFRCGRRDKGARILRETRAIEWTYTPSEFAALREELRLIKLFRPRFNVTGKRDAEHYTFLRITAGPAPRLAVTRGGASGDGVCYGPFIGPHLVAEAARELSDALGLRDCSDSVPIHYRDSQRPPPLGLRTQSIATGPQSNRSLMLATGPQAAANPCALRAPSVSMGPQAAPNPDALRAPDCIRHDVGKCLGPCIAACDASDYEARVAMARAFLEGESNGPIERFRREMEESKRKLAYERAALYRDRIIRLEKLRDQFSKIRFAVEAMSLVYPVPGFRGEDRVYLIRRGTVRAEAAAPRSTVERLGLQGLIDQVFQPREPQRGAVRTHEIEEILLLSSWFRRYPAELERAWAPVIS